MKKYILFLFGLLALVACNTRSQQEKEYYFTKDIKDLILCCDSFDLNDRFCWRRMDDEPEYFLRRERLAKYRIESQDTLTMFQELLHQSTLLEQDSDITCDTDIAALVEYVDGTTDTLSIPINLSRGFILGMKRFDNKAFIDSVLHALAFRDSLWMEVLERTYWKGDYKFRGIPVYSEDRYVPNYGMFANTEAETLAKYMCDENIDSIVSLVKRNPKIMYTRDAKDRYPIVLHCVLFQQDTVLKTLLDLGYDPNYYFPEEDEEPQYKRRTSFSAYSTPLIIASEDSYCNKCGELLVQYGANVNLQMPDHGRFYSPLSSAMTGDNYEMAKFLIENGADVNAYGMNGYLIEKPGVPDLVMEREYPIDYARKRYYFKMIYLLLSHGANPDTPYSRRVGNFNSYMESVNLDKLSSADKRYVQKIKDYLKNMDLEKTGL